MKTFSTIRLGFCAFWVVVLLFCIFEFLFACYGVVQFCGRSARFEQSKLWEAETSRLTSELTECRLLLSACVGKVPELDGSVLRKQTVTLSFYHPWSQGINSDSDPDRTATMTKPTVGRTVAISTELFDIGWLGSRVYIEGFGVFKAEDRMGLGVVGKQIDICVSSKERAFQLGLRRGVVAVRL